MWKKLVNAQMKGTQDWGGWPQKKHDENGAAQSVTRVSQGKHSPEAGLGLR